MPTRYLKIIIIVFLSMLLFTSKGYSQPDSNEQHILVSMRMIGHQLLLNSGDSTSLILPVEKEKDRYKIQFGSEFQFNPDELVVTIDSIVKLTGITEGYIVEVKKCGTDEVIYSYEMGNSANSDLVPCAARTQPKACYTLFITLLDESRSGASLQIISEQTKGSSPGKGQPNYFMIVLLVILLVMGIGLFFYLRKKKPSRKLNEHIICLGEYLFDKKNMVLSYGNEKTDLSGTEADLLFLLYTSENKTLERDHILKIVWGDDGDYIGRTLDVFISKLRKKLEADPSVKIVNIRGKGYKLILSDAE